MAMMALAVLGRPLDNVSPDLEMAVKAGRCRVREKQVWRVPTENQNHGNHGNGRLSGSTPATLSSQPTEVSYTKLTKLAKSSTRQNLGERNASHRISERA
ncbi:hypothetical protein SUGI_0101020 [Cryptomeria japonica]|nr:hypothetical protein SUGI_0101020 [Cryptomeria japonica]